MTVRYARVDRFLVPLDSSPAVRYFRANLRVAHSMRERLNGGVLQASPPLAAPTPPVEADLLAAAGIGNPSETRWLYVSDYDGNSRGRVVAFVFAADSTKPAAVVKFRSAGSGGRSLAREYDALRKVRAALPPPLAETVPRAIAFREENGSELLVLSALDGRPAYLDMQNSLVPSWHVARHFEAAASWLAAFHSATAAGDAAAHHGDFWARNLLLQGGHARLVDWEHFLESAPRAFDLFHFPLTYGLNYLWRGYRRAGAVDAFSRTFLETTAVSRSVGLYLTRYAERSGLSMDDLRRWFTSYLEMEGSPRGAAEEAGVLKGALPWQRLKDMHLRSSRSVFSG